MSDSIYAVRLFTRDSPPAAAFYRDTVGWPLRFESAELGWAEFGTLAHFEDPDGNVLTLLGVPERGH